MSNFWQKTIITIYILILIGTACILGYYGRHYYNLPIENRYYTSTGAINPQHELLKPSGFIGHGLGIIGSTLIVIGLFGYMARKRIKIFSRWGMLKNWLELHIFICTLGTIMVVFHTSFKFGGLISIGFWSLIIVWLSGVVGRFIYLQLPHSIEGRELTLNEINVLKDDLNQKILSDYNVSVSDIKDIKPYHLNTFLKQNGISLKQVHRVKILILKERRISRQLQSLTHMQKLFRYWHVAHLPFALIMIIIMIVHVLIQLYFGYKWIF